MAEKIDDRVEHREDSPAMGKRCIDLAGTLSIEESAKKVRWMMMEAIKGKAAVCAARGIIMTEKEKMLAGELYDPSDAELAALLIKARKLARRYNQTDEDEPEKRTAIQRELLPNTPNLPGLQAPIYFDYGCNTTFGRFSGANFNFTCLDVCPVHIGENVLIGPNVTLATPMHPLLPEERNVRQDENGRYYNLEYAKPITIENDCWLASNVVVCGGVTIGEGCVIGAGSVVTKDIPPS